MGKSRRNLKIVPRPLTQNKVGYKMDGHRSFKTEGKSVNVCIRGSYTE